MLPTEIIWGDTKGTYMPPTEMRPGHQKEASRQLWREDRVELWNSTELGFQSAVLFAQRGTFSCGRGATLQTSGGPG